VKDPHREALFSITARLVICRAADGDVDTIDDIESHGGRLLTGSHYEMMKEVFISLSIVAVLPCAYHVYQCPASSCLTAFRRQKRMSCDVDYFMGRDEGAGRANE